MPSLSSAVDKAKKLSMFVSEFYADMTTYIRYCGVSPMQDATKRRYYKLLIEAHALEKGLSLKSPRPLFGRSKLAFLMKELERYDLSYSLFPAEMAAGVFDTYVRTHREQNISDPLLDELEGYISKLSTSVELVRSGGLRHFETAYEFNNLMPQSFLTSRFSNRAMSKEPLSCDVIADAVQVAQATPSQCNRQAAQAHFYQDSIKIAELLALQGGANGFAQDVGNLLVISCDLSAWGGAQQRNQVYVDGALFSMSLIYALHAAGVATCPLNLAVRNKREKSIKTAGDIPQDQRLIMMIAVGTPLEDNGFKAAASPRRPKSEVFHIHG
jgi:nitroreductase